MKFKKVTLATLLVVSAVSAVSSVYAANTIKWKGSITSASCNIDNDSADQNISLGDFSKALLEKNRETSPEQFHIKLLDCDASVGAGTVAVTFTGSKSGNDLALNGPMANDVALRILDTLGGDVVIGTPTPAKSIRNGTNVLSFQAKLVTSATSGSVTPGEFDTTANFRLDYP
ncbi:fimbrial protein [Pseudomonas fontis]|uniref:Type 1 fimbrial protein n=1 Tax=Pseudomonas fontis TaxID=2942633 RepID=A0ABT5NQ66_9PSED|nr:fimbrial protein [Pseudomonas fontis]MDD0972842.1 type 1 fimbrial protein [Pseudomonas fontis]MDD0990299.1 type 1 fimbrial protein [Pseudomonas fontis]